jgi:hypothetical protein
MRPKRILIGSVTSVAKNYCIEPWSKNILAIQEYGRNLGHTVDVLVVDNSKSDHNIKLLKQKGLPAKWKWHLKNPGIKQVIAECCNMLRDKVINEKYDFLLMVESDVFPPVNCIQLLLLFNKGIVCLPYFHGIGKDSKLVISDIHKTLGVPIGQKMSEQEGFIEFNGQLKQVYQPGLGCVLIRQNVFRAVKFRIAKPDDPGYFSKAYHDAYFHIDCERLGIPVFMFMGCICKHLNNNILS